MLARDSAGFRLRGMNMTRIETFTDAAFAFALTLLVISMDPPTTMASLDGALRQIPAFLLSGSLLMMFWSGHHNWSRRFGLDDATTIVLSCLLVFTMLVYVYPLRFMFSSMMAWIGDMVNLPLGPERDSLGIHTLEDVNRMFVIYGLGFIAMSSAIILLNLHAWGKRDLLELDAVERHATRSELGAGRSSSAPAPFRPLSPLRSLMRSRPPAGLTRCSGSSCRCTAAARASTQKPPRRSPPVLTLPAKAPRGATARHSQEPYARTEPFPAPEHCCACHCSSRSRSRAVVVRGVVLRQRVLPRSG
jgi:hypothetical protein